MKWLKGDGVMGKEEIYCYFCTAPYYLLTMTLMLLMMMKISNASIPSLSISQFNPRRGRKKAWIWKQKGYDVKEREMQLEKGKGIGDRNVLFLQFNPSNITILCN